MDSRCCRIRRSIVSHEVMPPSAAGYGVALCYSVSSIRRRILMCVRLPWCSGKCGATFMLEKEPEKEKKGKKAKA